MGSRISLIHNSVRFKHRLTHLYRCVSQLQTLQRRRGVLQEWIASTQGPSRSPRLHEQSRTIPGRSAGIAAMSAARARWSKSVTSRGWYRNRKGLGALHMG